MKESKKSALLDLGARIQASFETKGSHNRLVSYKLRSNVDARMFSYDEAILFLRLIAAFAKAMPDGVPNSTLFRDYESLVWFLSGEERKKALILFLLKFVKTLGILDESGEKWYTRVARLAKALELYDFERTLSIDWIDDAFLSDAKSAVELSLHRYLS